eukprot:COSAG01_NODE_46802_length_396_cov_9.585859_1_plen_49_part_01
MSANTALCLSHSRGISGDVAGVARVDCGDGVGIPAPKSKSKSTKCYSSS